MKDTHHYNAIQITDTHSDSSTEVEDSDTESAVKPRQRRSKTCWQRTRRYRWILDTALLFVIVGLLVEKRWTSRQHSTRFELLGDLTGFAPSFSQQIVTFKPDPVFAPENASEFWSDETKQAWLDIVPEGLGYLNIPTPSLYDNLPHPLHDYPNHTVYTTSVTHQLHCLYTILEAYNIQKLKLSPDSSSPYRNRINMPWHITHCFEYIRQAIMCAGDVALEGAETTFPKGKNGEDMGGSDGWDARHVCRDYGEVVEYLEERTINHFKWISSDE